MDIHWADMSALSHLERPKPIVAFDGLTWLRLEVDVRSGAQLVGRQAEIRFEFYRLGSFQQVLWGMYLNGNIL